MFRDDDITTYNYGGHAAWSHAIGKAYYIEPQLNAGSNNAMLKRTQGNQPYEAIAIDSLSPDFDNHYSYIRPGCVLSVVQKNSNTVWVRHMSKATCTNN